MLFDNFQGNETDKASVGCLFEKLELSLLLFAKASNAQSSLLEVPRQEAFSNHICFDLQAEFKVLSNRQLFEVQQFKSLFLATQFSLAIRHASSLHPLSFYSSFSIFPQDHLSFGQVLNPQKLPKVIAAKRLSFGTIRQKTHLFAKTKDLNSALDNEIAIEGYVATNNIIKLAHITVIIVILLNRYNILIHSFLSIYHYNPYQYRARIQEYLVNCVIEGQ